MDRARPEMTKENMKSWTRNARERTCAAIEFADRLRIDPERENREQAGLCRWCYYSFRLGGQALTRVPCMCCGKMQVYSSSASADVLCADCARETDLCKHCGGDREGCSLQGGEMRQEWPMPKEKTG